MTVSEIDFDHFDLDHFDHRKFHISHKTLEPYLATLNILSLDNEKKFHYILHCAHFFVTLQHKVCKGFELKRILYGKSQERYIACEGH